MGCDIVEEDCPECQSQVKAIEHSFVCSDCGKSIILYECCECGRFW
jgi:hypothetical protein